VARDVVYLGPSLAVGEARRLLPDAEFLPPVRHRDLLRLDVGPGDRVLIIDGLFMHAAPVRHREILGLLERGVVVAGSSSMGALRAAELHGFGMRGVGTVFELYRSGTVTGDDEVAVVHGPAEEGYRSLSEPLVNVRVALGAAAAAGAISPAEADRLLELLREQPFRARSYRALGRLAGAAAARFLAWQHEHRVDAKGADARLLLSLAATGPDALAPAGPADLPIRNVATKYYQTWVSRHRGRPGPHGQYVTEAQAAGALMALHPRYAELHRADALRRLLGESAVDRSPVDSSTVDTGVAGRALALAAERGLVVGVGAAAPGPGGWFTGAECAALAAAGPEAVDAATLRLLVRAFGSVTHKRVALENVPPALAVEPVLARVRSVVARAQALAERMPRSPIPSAGRMRLKADAVLGCYADLWGVPVADMQAAVWDRGFADLDSFWQTAEPYVLYLRTFGAPDLGDRAAA
jgi:hypothetical protein